MSKLKLFKKVIMTTGGIALSASVASSATAADLTVASWGGSYQDAQSKALFVPGAKAMGISIKEETYSGMSEVRLMVNSGAVTKDIVSSG